MRYFASLVSFSIFALALAPAAAEIWACNGSLYTSQLKNEANCEQLKNQVVCGREGNKYYAPFRPGVRDASASCEMNSGRAANRNVSPFVNMRFAESYRDYRAPATKKFAEHPAPQSASPADGISSALGNIDTNAFRSILDLMQTNLPMGMR